MNAYRNSGDREDWTYIRNRLISSKIVNVNDIDENILCLMDNTYLPFSNISFDDDTILKFVKAFNFIAISKSKLKLFVFSKKMHFCR